MRNYETRVSPDIIVSDDIYLNSLLDLCSFMATELSDLLDLEGKIEGEVRDSIFRLEQCALEYILWDEEEIEWSERIMYLHRPQIVAEYQRLIKARRLERSDAMIVILRKLIYTVRDLDTTGKCGNLKALLKPLNQLWEKIGGRAKKDPLYALVSQIKTCIGLGSVGRYRIPGIQIDPQENNSKEILKPGTQEKLGKDELQVTEVKWTDD